MSQTVLYLLVIIGIFIGGFALIIWLSGESISLLKRIVAALLGFPITLAGIFMLTQPDIDPEMSLIFLIAGVGLIALVTFASKRQRMDKK